MSWSQPANKRLLWSILHAPAQPVPTRTHISHTAGRSLSTSPSRCGLLKSTFSFGPEGDNLIGELARKSRAEGNLAYPKTAKAPKKGKQEGSSEKEVNPAKASDQVHIFNSADAHQQRLLSSEPVATTNSVEDVKIRRTLSTEPLARAFQPRNPKYRLAAKGPLQKDHKAKKQLKDVRESIRSILSEAKGENRQPSPPQSAPRQTSQPAAPTDTASKKPPKDAVATAAAARLEAARLANRPLPNWAVQKLALAAKFGAEGWNPRRKLSPDARLGIRTLHEDNPATFTSAVLAQQFKISPEAIRRILKSKWLAKSGPEKVQELRERWAGRHDKIWDTKAELGLRPAREDGQEHRVRDAAEGADEVEHSLWAEETLGKAREDNPLFQPRFQKKARS